MKTLLSVLISCACLVLMLSCSNSRKNYTSLTAQEFEQQVQIAENQVLDVRTADEYARGHIENALNIDVKMPDFAKHCAEKLQKGRPVCVYCRSGRRSKTAADILADMGFEVLELDKGILSWKGKLSYGAE